MVTTKSDIFYLLDRIDTEMSENDISVLEAVLDTHEKAVAILEQASIEDLDTSSFNVFQESTMKVIDGKAYYSDKGFRRLDENGELESQLMAFLKMIPRLIQSIIDTINKKLNKDQSNSESLSAPPPPDPVKQIPPKKRKTVQETWDYVYTHKLRVGASYGSKDLTITKESHLGKLIELKKKYVNAMNKTWNSLKYMVSKLKDARFFKLKTWGLMKPKIAKGCKKKKLMSLNINTGEITTLIDLKCLEEFVDKFATIVKDTSIFINKLNSTEDKLSAISNWKMMDDVHHTQTKFIFMSPTTSYSIPNAWVIMNRIIVTMRQTSVTLNKNGSAIKKTINDITNKKRQIAAKTGPNPKNNVKMRLAIRKLNGYLDLLTIYQTLSPMICDTLIQIRGLIRVTSEIYNETYAVVNHEIDTFESIIEYKDNIIKEDVRDLEEALHEFTNDDND